MTVTVIVATHRTYRMPREACYLPLHVGRAISEPIGYAGDDTGDNISEKNPYYCELTGLYWMWKHLGSDYLGLVHYRRYLGKAGFRGIWHAARRRTDASDARAEMVPQGGILAEKDILKLMRKADILLPKKRNYYIESIYEHYAHTHYAEHLDKAREVIAARHPDYLAAFDEVMTHRSAHMFNMFVMSRAKCDEYCTWLFDILCHLEPEIDVSIYDSFQARVFGRVGELLLDVWLEKNRYPYVEAPTVYLEKKRTLTKIYYFMRSKLLGEKYRKSV